MYSDLAFLQSEITLYVCPSRNVKFVFQYSSSQRSKKNSECLSLVGTPLLDAIGRARADKANLEGALFSSVKVVGGRQAQR